MQPVLQLQAPLRAPFFSVTSELTRRDLPVLPHPSPSELRATKRRPKKCLRKRWKMRCHIEAQTYALNPDNHSLSIKISTAFFYFCENTEAAPEIHENKRTSEEPKQYEKEKF